MSRSGKAFGLGVALLAGLWLGTGAPGAQEPAGGALGALAMDPAVGRAQTVRPLELAAVAQAEAAAAAGRAGGARACAYRAAGAGGVDGPRSRSAPASGGRSSP